MFNNIPWMNLIKLQINFFLGPHGKGIYCLANWFIVCIHWVQDL